MEETPDHGDREAVTEILKKAAKAVEDASYEILLKKPTREIEFFVHVEGDDGRPKPVRLRYRAMPPKDFDDLVAAHPPSSKAQREGAQWNKDTFPAALLSAVSLVPRMTLEEAGDLLHAPNWSAGESQALFFNALNVCNAGFDVPFSDGA